MEEHPPRKICYYCGQEVTEIGFKVHPQCRSKANYERQKERLKRNASNTRKRYTIEDLYTYAHQHGGQCLSPVYLGSSSMHQFQCKNGHLFGYSWNTMIHSLKWCPICDYCEKYDVSYISFHNETYTFKCLLHGEFQVPKPTGRNMVFKRCPRCLHHKKFTKKLNTIVSIPLSRTEIVLNAPPVKDSVTACKVVQCDPSIHFFESIFPLLNQIWLNRYGIPCPDHDRITRAIRAINKRAFKKKTFPRYMNIVGIAIYCASSRHIAQEEICAITNITSATMRKWMQLLKIRSPESVLYHDPQILQPNLEKNALRRYLRDLDFYDLIDHVLKYIKDNQLQTPAHLFAKFQVMLSPHSPKYPLPENKLVYYATIRYNISGGGLGTYVFCVNELGYLSVIHTTGEVQFREHITKIPSYMRNMMIYFLTHPPINV